MSGKFLGTCISRACRFSTNAPVRMFSTVSRRQPLIKFIGKRAANTAQACPHALHSESHAKSTMTKSSSSKPVQVTIPGAYNDEEESTEIPLSTMRRVISQRLTESKTQNPHHYATIETEIDQIMALRRELKVNHKINVSVNDFLVKATACALHDVPEANCSISKKGEIKWNSNVDVSIAVATPTGLITPIIPQVQSKGLTAIHDKFKDVVTKARNNKLKPEEFQGGSITISSLGSFGIKQFSAIINPPQAIILAIGAGTQKLVPPKGDDINTDAPPRMANIMTVTLSANRRIVDENIAGQFLQVLKQYLENPLLLTL